MDDGLILLFDGYCGLCNQVVAFILRRDKRQRFRFAALQSPAGMELLKSAQAPVGVDSMVLVEDGKAWVRSTAALKIARGLGFPWSLARVLLLVPRDLRDTVYDRIAASRYTWFGREEECRVPSEAERSRFLG